MDQQTQPATTAPIVTELQEPSRSTQKLRLWPAVVMLALFWTFLYAHYTFELAMFSRFISRMIAYGLLLLAFLGWWLTRRQVLLRDRLLAVGLVMVTSIIAGLLADASVDPFVLFMSAFPFVFTAWTLWLLVSRSWSPVVQRAGFCAVIVATTGFFALLRWDGLYGNQIPQFSWRWSATPEELFLKSHEGPSAANRLADNPAPPLRERSLQPGDWPEFRGPERNAVVRNVRIDTDWNANPPQLLWRKRVGPGWSSVIVVDGFLATQEQRGEYEAVVCYDAATGLELWAHNVYERFYEGLSGAGPRGTPTFNDGRVYALGGTGRLVCLTARDGQPLWSRDTVKDAGGTVPQWGYSVSPLVVENKVVVFTGGADKQALVAFDADSGAPVWSVDGGTMSYSSPQWSTLHGQQQILMHDNQALRAVSVEDGRLLWQHATSSEVAMPMLQPHQAGDNRLVLATDPGVALLQIRRDGETWSVEQQWSSNRLKPSFNDFVVYHDHIYGLDDGILTCVDLADGRRIWKKGRYGHGQLVLQADQGLLLILTESGELVLVSAIPDRHEELGRFQAIEGKSWNHPVLAQDRIFVRNAEEMAVFRIR
jgi:outer membrane protein assembly factor BamB